MRYTPVYRVRLSCLIFTVLADVGSPLFNGKEPSLLLISPVLSGALHRGLHKNKTEDRKPDFNLISLKKKLLWEAQAYRDSATETSAMTTRVYLHLLYLGLICVFGEEKAADKSNCWDQIWQQQTNDGLHYAKMCKTVHQIIQMHY